MKATFILYIPLLLTLLLPSHGGIPNTAVFSTGQVSFINTNVSVQGQEEQTNTIFVADEGKAFRVFKLEFRSL